MEELSEVQEIGPIIARSVYEFVHSEYGETTIDDLRRVGVVMDSPRTSTTAADGVLSGKILVVTGTLTRYSRDEIEELIARHGGRAASSVSKNTDYLVAGEKAGSKLAKAEQLGVPVLSEDQFDALLAAGGAQ